MADNAVVQVDTAFKRFLGVTDVVVAPNIVDRYLAGAVKETQVFRRQITTGNDQVHILAAIRSEFPIKRRFHHI
jgi:hypothetical protein